MAATPDPNAYETLGLPRTATQDEIKKRYRELARKLHPDVNQSNPSASRQFSQVSQAYKLLSDVDTRKLYDAENVLREQRMRQAPARYAASPPAPGSASARTGAPSPRPAAAPSPAADAARIAGEARTAFLRDRQAEARTLAETALRLDIRNAEAWEVLGDVFRRKGRNEDAINAYSMSLQINPRNASVMQRLERMAAGSAGARTTASPTGSRPAAASRPFSSGTAAGYGSNSGGANSRAYTPGRASRFEDPDKRPLRILLTAFVGYGAVFMAILYAALAHGDPPLNTVPLLAWVSHWNGTITTLLASCGFVLGATMTVTGAIRRIDDELILSGVAARGGTFLPLGLILVVLSVINFYFAAIVYAIITALQESFTSSMMRVFGVVVGTVALLALAYTPDHLQVLIFGGNVVFVTFVIGWLLGDFFRPDMT